MGELGASAGTGADIFGDAPPSGRWDYPMFGLRALIAGLAFAGLSGFATAAGSKPDAAAEELQKAQAEYLQSCASCHGKNFDGGFGPPLTGPRFKARWAAKAPTDMRQHIASTMPPSEPGALAADTYDRLAWLIRRHNGLADAPVNAAAPATATAAGGSTGSTSKAPDTTAALMESGGTGVAEVNRDPEYVRLMKARSARLEALRPVTQAMLEKPDAGDWLHYRRDGLNTGFSPLRQITRANAGRLTLGWALTLPAGTNAITPLVHDGIMFVNSSGTVMALDGATGDILWKFDRAAKLVNLGPPITQPRGMAIYRDRLIVPTIDNHIIALDMRTGKPVWDSLIPGMRETLRITAAPLVVGNRIIQGLSGCGTLTETDGCFIVGLDADTGKEMWRFYTIAKEGKPGGDSWNVTPNDKRTGGSVWVTPSYDPETGLVYVGTSQTYHIAGLMRPNGDRSAANAALYTDSTLALDPQTGQLKWHYQHMDREVWDLDWSFERTIATVPVKGKPRRVIMTVGKIGMMDMIDARTGQYIASYDLGYQDLVTSVDPVTGRKTTNPNAEPDPAKPKFICPFATGVRNWPATSFDPATNTMFVPITKNCMEFTWNKGQDFDIMYSLRVRPDNDGNIGGLAAIDIATLKPRWEVKYRASTASAVLATSGGIVFAGGRDRMFRAWNAGNGAALWEARLDNTPSASPISYMANGQQYVAITTGGGNPNDAVTRSLNPEIEPAQKGTTLWTFRLSR